MSGPSKYGSPELQALILERLGEPYRAPPLKIGGKYNWRGQPERLVYLGKKGSWHQFRKVGDDRDVWCEVLDADLPSIEETKESP